VSYIDLPISITCSIWTPIFEWRVADSENGYQNDMCRLLAQNMIIILGSIVNIILFYLGGGVGGCVQLMSTRVFTLIMNKIFT
jgi:hypothetical protein